MGKSLLVMGKCLVVLLLVLVLCEFVVGSVYSEVETSFVIMSPERDSGLSFWGMYGDYLLAGVIVLIVIVVYLNGIKGSKKRGK